MKRVSILVLVALSLIGCAGNQLTTKSWHASPSSDPRSSTIYPFVSWSIVQQLHPGIRTVDARRLVFELQSYDHPVNVILYSRRGSRRYEIALKLSGDGERVEEIGYKKVTKTAEQDGPGTSQRAGQ